MQLRTLAYSCCRSLALAIVLLTFCVAVKILYTGHVLNKQEWRFVGEQMRITPDNESSSPARGYLSVFKLEDVDQLAPAPTVPPERRDAFKTSLAKKELDMMAKILQKFHEVMTNSSLVYFIYKGSLLGSYRHHGPIPWDDDFDVIVNFKDKDQMKVIFEYCGGGFELVFFDHRFKFFHTSGKPVESWNYKWPYLDVSFYLENDTHLWDQHLKKQRAFNKTIIFPLQYRPFLGHMFLAPRDPLANLQVTYNIDDCYTGKFSHMEHQRKNLTDIFTVPCSAMVESVPFVNHVRGPAGSWCEEVLTFKGEVLNTFIRSSKNIPVC